MFDSVSSPLKLCRSITMGWNYSSNGKCHAAIKLFVGAFQAFGKETLAAAFQTFYILCNLIVAAAAAAAIVSLSQARFSLSIALSVPTSLVCERRRRRNEKRLTDKVLSLSKPPSWRRLKAKIREFNGRNEACWKRFWPARCSSRRNPPNWSESSEIQSGSIMANKCFCIIRRWMWYYNCYLSPPNFQPASSNFFRKISRYIKSLLLCREKKEKSSKCYFKIEWFPLPLSLPPSFVLLKFQSSFNWSVKSASKHFIPRWP